MSRSRLLVVLAVLAGIGVPAAAVHADPPAMPDAKLVLVLDASSSMLEPDAAGGTRIDAAKTALHQVIAGLDPTEQVGFRVFGATVSGLETPGACEDSQLLVPIGTDNREALTAAVDQYTPYGETPIGYALQQAAGDVGTEGQRSILLVTDGEANCDPEPCEVARQIAANDINLTINTVGLNVGPEARTQLQCIADAGHGTYFDAQDAPTLVAAMDRLATRAFRHFAVTGTPVTGTPTPDGAPELTPGGQYTDILDTADATRHYLVRRTMPGSSIHVGFTAMGAGGTEGQAGLHLGPLDGSDCAFSYPTSFGTDWVLMAGQVTAWADPGDLEDPCGSDDLLVLRVETTDWGDAAGTPFELTVREEPPVAASSVMPPSVFSEGGNPQWQPLTADGAGGPAVGGSSMNDATLLAPGSYTTDLLPGETVFYRVPVEWGRSLQAQADFAPPGPALAEAIDSVFEVKMTLMSPNRGDVIEEFVDGNDSSYSTLLSNEASTQLTAITAPVRWWNREFSEGQHTNQNGEYYVAVTAELDEDGQSFVIPFTLTIGVFGTAGDGAPTYDETPLDPSVTTEPADTAAPATTAPPTAAPPTTPPLTTVAATPPEGYMTLVDDTGVLTMTVPQTWNDIVSTTNEDDAGVHRPAIEASPNLLAFEIGYEVPGAWIQTVAFTDPPAEIDRWGAAGCASFTVEPFARDTLTGLAQVGTGCGSTGQGLFKLVVANPPDQSVSVVLIVQVASAADQAAFDLVLLSFGLAAQGAVSVNTVPLATRPPVGTVPVAALTPGRGLDGPIDVLPPANPGEVTVLGVHPEAGGEGAVVLFRNGTDQPIASFVLEGRLYAPDGSVIVEFTESDLVYSEPSVIDPGGIGFYAVDYGLDLDDATLPAGFTHDLTVRAEAPDDLGYIQLETTNISNDGDFVTATISNPWEIPVPAGLGPTALCLDAAGAVLLSMPGYLNSDAEVDTIEPGGSVEYVFDSPRIYDVTCAHVLVVHDVFAPV